MGSSERVKGGVVSDSLSLFPAVVEEEEEVFRSFCKSSNTTVYRGIISTH